jgi:hypothetical protein
MNGLPQAGIPRPAQFARFATLPTVWSNCLAAAWLAQGWQLDTWPEFLLAVHWPQFLLVLTGSSLVLTGWEAARGRTQVPADTAGSSFSRPNWVVLAGSLLIAVTGRTPAMLAVVLLALASGDLLLPRASPFGPCFRGLARVSIYLAAAATTVDGISGWPIWGGVVMAAFVVGLEFVVRQQELQQPLEPAPLLLLVSPLVLAWVMNNGTYRMPALLLSAVLVLWLARGLRQLFWPAAGKPAMARVELLPAIVLVDWLAVADAPRTSGLLFLPLFLAAFGLCQALRARTGG